MKVRSIICSFVFDDHRRIFEEIELKEDNRKDITSALKNDVHLSSLSQSCTRIIIKSLCETCLMTYKCRIEVSSLIPWALSLFLVSRGVTWRKKLLLVPSVMDDFHLVTLKELRELYFETR